VLDGEERVGVHFADIDLKRIEEVRRSLPALRHRRPIPEVA
jgi:deaminated glutathione amidase